MYHAPIDTVTDLTPANQAGHDLTVLVAGLEQRFVAAGTLLAEAIAATDDIVGALDSVSAALDARRAGSAGNGLRDVANRLAQLPDAQATRLAGMKALEGAARELRTYVLGARDALQVLRIYGMNINIAAAGNSAFAAFVENMTRRLTVGEAEVTAILGEIQRLSNETTGVGQAEAILTAECAKILPHVPQRLLADADALQEYMARMGALATDVSARTRAVQGRVATVLGAMQVGDSTRQRLEHVVTGLGLMGGGVPNPAVEDHVRRLLSVQIVETATVFDDEVATLFASLEALRPEMQGLVALIGDASGSDGQTVLARLDEGISEVAQVTGHVREADARSRAVVEGITDAVEELAVRLAAMRRMQLNVLDIATNTRLLSRRFGTIGKAVSVIAVEIDAYTGKLSDFIEQIDAAVATLGDVRDQLSIPAGEAGDMQTTLAEALAVIRSGCGQTEVATRRGAAGANRLAELLDRVGTELAGEMAVGTTMRAAAALLTPMPEPAPLDAEAEAVLETVSGAIYALYTMAAERDVHAGVIPAHLLPPPPAASALDDDDDDGLF